MSEITEPAILLREMREISFALTRHTWSDDLAFELWAALVGEGDTVGGKPLPVPVLAHIDALGKYSDDAGGWLTSESVEGFVDFDTWEARYAQWKAARQSHKAG